MPALLGPEELAALVSKVTEAMCQTTFVPDDPLARGESLYHQMVMIPLRGEKDIVVVVSFDERGGRALGAAFFGCAERDLTQSMIDDVIAELLNMVAGQISGATSFTYSLGIPRRTNIAEFAPGSGLELDEAILLRGEGRADLRLWILQTSSPEKDGDKDSPPKMGVFRSLVRRFTPTRFGRA